MRLKKIDRLFFTEQIALLLLAGVPIISALELLLASSNKRSLKYIIEKLKMQVASGASISSVLQSFPKSFSPLYVALVGIGEVSGKLSEMFNYLAKIEKKRLEAAAKIQKALIYPFMVLLVAVAVLLFILIAVVPTFEMLYQSSGAELPPVTQKVIDISHFLLSSRGRNLLFILLGGILFIRRLYRRRGRFRYFIDRIFLKIPMLSAIFLASFNASFAEVLSVLIRSGVPLVKGIELYGRGVENTFIFERLTLMSEDLKKGGSFQRSAQDSQIFSNVSLTLISVGEVSGSLGRVLERSGEYHSEVVDKKVDTLISLLDPLSMLVIGLLVGVILIALYLPMFSMGSAI